MKLYVAVVANKDINKSGRPIGDLASFIGDDQNDVIERAIRAARLWESQLHSDMRTPRGPYRILVGTLTEEASTVYYELADITENEESNG